MILSERCGYILLAIALAAASVASIAKGFSPKRTLSALLLAAYVSFIVTVLCLPMYLTPTSSAIDQALPLMIMPSSYYSFMAGYSGGVVRAASSLLARAALLAPLGVLAPLSLPRFRAWRHALPLFAATSISIELLWALQCLLVGSLYRPVSFDGALASFMGLMLGHLAFHLCSRLGRALRGRSFSR